MWNEYFVTQQQSDADLRDRPLRNIYGQHLVAAESMTTLGTPGAHLRLRRRISKPTVDRELADGSIALSCTLRAPPLANKAPGATLGPFGQWFTQTRRGPNRRAPDYISRTQQLSAAQGSFAPMGVIYYYAGFNSQPSMLTICRLPEGYAFDFATRCTNTLSVYDGDWFAVSACVPHARARPRAKGDVIGRTEAGSATCITGAP